jgi:hypothetical protein
MKNMFCDSTLHLETVDSDQAGATSSSRFSYTCGDSDIQVSTILQILIFSGQRLILGRFDFLKSKVDRGVGKWQKL